MLETATPDRPRRPCRLPELYQPGRAPHSAVRMAGAGRRHRGDPQAEAGDATPSSWRTTTRRRTSSTPSPTSSATAWRWRARRRAPTPTVIVLAGVHFMAETAKLLNPEKTVLIPDSRAGCSLAESITAADVRLLRERHPGVPIVTYVNTSAAVKAETDICCTSGNAKKIVEGARRAARSSCCRTSTSPATSRPRPMSRSSPGRAIARCMSASRRRTSASCARAYPGVTVLAHPECPPEVVAECDFTGSTAAMADYVGTEAAAARRAADRMLDERQRRAAIPRSRIRAAVQSVPAHEADHA